MEIKQALILDGGNPLSKALDELMESGTAVIVTRGGTYYGIIDDRNLREGISDPSRIKCDSVCIRAPVITHESTLLEKINFFLSGHFKALPVLDQKGRPAGIYTRADLLKELTQMKIMPKDRVHSLMNSPVYTVKYDETVAGSKKLMKDRGVNRIVVVRGGRPVGIVSTHDFTTYLVRPQAKEGKSIITGTTNPNNMQVSNFMRDEVPSIGEEALLDDAVRKMADGNFSSLIVMSGTTPKGVISATDIFRKVLKLSSIESDVSISGLSKDDQKHYEYIKSAILAAINKFSKSFEISGITLHFKKGKSVYLAQMHASVDGEPLILKAEDYTLGETIDTLCKEIHIVLKKKKGILKESNRRRRK